MSRFEAGGFEEHALITRVWCILDLSISKGFSLMVLLLMVLSRFSRDWPSSSASTETTCSLDDRFGYFPDVVFEDDLGVVRHEPPSVHVARAISHLRCQVQRLRVPLQPHILQLDSFELFLQMDDLELVSFLLIQETSDERVLLLNSLSIIQWYLVETCYLSLVDDQLLLEVFLETFNEIVDHIR